MIDAQLIPTLDAAELVARAPLGTRRSVEVGEYLYREADTTYDFTFVFIFPVVTMLIIDGAFGTKPDVAFDWINPSHWYVASYLTVVIAATGLIMVPVHLASYRERGVLRRFAAAGFPRWSFAVAQLVTGLAAVAAASVVLLAVAAPTYGFPTMHHAAGAIIGFVLGAMAFVAIGVLLGSVLPSARSAQAVGLVLFFPSFLLGAGGPPTLRDGLRPPHRRQLPAADPGDRRRARFVARGGHGQRLTDNRRGPGRRRYGPGHAPVGPLTLGTLGPRGPTFGPGHRGRSTIDEVPGDRDRFPGPAPLGRRAGRVGLGAYTVFLVIGLPWTWRTRPWPPPGR
jgi:ABC-2 type transport system permease protein